MPETFLHGVELLEVDTGSRPIRTVRSSVIGLVGTGNSDGIKATAQIGTVNGALRFTAITEGVAGNLFTITTIKPAINSAVLTCTITGNAITISLATDATQIATSTASQVMAAINAVVAINTKVLTTLGTGSTGASLYAVHAATPLAGGTPPTFPLDVPVLVTSGRNVDQQLGANTYLGKSLESIYQQAGAVVIVVRTSNVSGDAISQTGVYAFKKSQTLLGYTPRILVAEGGSVLAVAGSLKSVAKSLRAFAIIGLSDATFTSETIATAWTTANGNDRTYSIYPGVNGQDPAAFVAGLVSRSDNERGFWHSPSNQEIYGITSLDKQIDFQLGDVTSLANILNEGKVATFIRQGGFRLWGNLTGSIDPKYQFLSVRRTADIINDSILQNHLWAVDRNITKTYLQDVSGGVNDYLATLVNLGAIIGGTCWPDPDLNSPDQIALGKVYFNFDFTPPYPAQTVIFRSIITNNYLSELV